MELDGDLVVVGCRKIGNQGTLVVLDGSCTSASLSALVNLVHSLHCAASNHLSSLWIGSLALSFGF